MTIDPKTWEELKSLVVSGPPQEALRTVRLLQKDFPNDPNLVANEGVILMEIGRRLPDANIIGEGIERCQNALGLPSGESHRPFQLYNIATGHLDLFAIRKSQPNFAHHPNDRDLQLAKTYYREALQHESALPSEQNKKLWVNYGNCLSALGRSFEAMRAYHQALMIDPSFSMALGNKATEMAYLAHVTGEHKWCTLIEAYQLLQQALSDKELVEHGGPHAKGCFEAIARLIEQRFEDKAILQTPLQLAPPKTQPRRKFDKFYQEYCWKNRLYLNLWLHDQPSNLGLQDSISLVLLTPIGDTQTFARLASYLNQVKEDYAIARLLLVESQYPETHRASRTAQATKFIDTLDHSRWGIPASLLKAAFTISMNVLDKVAFFVNDYLDLKIRPRKVYFRSDDLWLQKKSKRTSASPDRKPTRGVRPEILEANNYSLFALYDIYVDSRSEPLKELWDIRNALTHRYLVVHEPMSLSPPPAEAHHHIEYTELLQHTLNAFQLVRAAILYLTSFVDIEERRKLAGGGEPAIPFFYRFL